MRRSILPALLLTWLPVMTAFGQEPALKPDAPEITLQQMLLWGGLWFMIPLALLSVLAMALIIFYFITLREERIVSRDFVTRAKKLIMGGDFSALEALCRQTNDLCSKVVMVAARAYLDNPNITHPVVSELAEAEGGRRATDLTQRISYLSDIAVISPMIGLLGTVVGMIKSFAVLAFDVASTRPLQLAEGVSQALITTAVGLIVAIPVMAFYSFFRVKMQKLIGDLESTTTDLVGRMQIASSKP